MSRNGRKSRKSRIFQTGLRPDPDIPDIPGRGRQRKTNH